MVTVTERAVSDVLNRIIEEVMSLNAKRLVIDSFSTLDQAFKEKIEARIILHTILGKIVKTKKTSLRMCGILGEWITKPLESWHDPDFLIEIVEELNLKRSSEEIAERDHEIFLRSLHETTDRLRLNMEFRRRG